MYWLFAAGCEPMESVLQGLPGDDINSNAVIGEACGFIDSYLMDKVGFPFDEVAKKGRELFFILKQICSTIAFGEPAFWSLWANVESVGEGGEDQ